jgi:hypothetical protein
MLMVRTHRLSRKQKVNVYYRPSGKISFSCELSQTFSTLASEILFGYMAEEESKGNRLFWAEWPISEADETASEETIRLAASRTQWRGEGGLIRA